MATNRFYTILIVPEKTSPVRRLIIPNWALKGTVVGIIFAFLIGSMMILDYWYVMSQIGENRQLKLENRRLRQQVQVFNNKMATIESTMERVRTFATRLKVITNIEDRGGLLQSTAPKLPDAAANISATAPPLNDAAKEPENPPNLAPPLTEQEDALLHKEYTELDHRFSLMNQETLTVEQILQDQYELLADQKAFLAALPTRKPAIGYFTSGFGVRKSPYGGREKMHEGLDIANHPGTSIHSPADGVVTFSDVKPGYGQTLIIDHGYGLETWYAHTRKILVGKGQKIHRGEQIALLGNSGRSTGPHVHYEVRVHGTPVDPLSYILEN